MRGDREPVVMAAPAHPSTRTAVPGRSFRSVGRIPGPTPIQRLTVWLRVGLGVLLGVLVLQWPYARGCGVGLVCNLTGLGVVVLGGTWGAIWSWRYRLTLAHAASLAVIYWGLLLAAHEVLQRAGYAAAAEPGKLRVEDGVFAPDHPRMENRDLHLLQSQADSGEHVIAPSDVDRKSVG